jgi:ribosomal protein L13
MKSFMANAEDVERKWYVVDAKVRLWVVFLQR